MDVSLTTALWSPDALVNNRARKEWDGGLQSNFRWRVHHMLSCKLDAYFVGAWNLAIPPELVASVSNVFDFSLEKLSFFPFDATPTLDLRAPVWHGLPMRSAAFMM